MKISKYLGLVLASAFFLCGCAASSLSTDKHQELENVKSSAVVQGTSVQNTYSVENAGIFYIGHGGSLLMYNDYEDGENYVLCGAPGCGHRDASCSAYVGDNYRNYTFACYGKQLYLMRKDSSDASEIELISMDLNGENRRVAAVIPAGDHSLNNWWMEDILPVYFAGGKALFLGTYFKTVPGVSDDETVDIQGEQLLMADLDTGEVQELTEILEYGSQVGRLQFVLITEKNAIYEVMTYKEPLITENEYARRYGNEERKKNYAAYYEQFVQEQEAAGTYYLMDFETGEATEIWSGDMYDFDKVMMGPAFNFSYNGDIYYSPAESYYGTEDDPLEIRRINGKTGEEEVVTPLPETVDEYWYMDQNSNGGFIYNEGEILLCNDFHEEESFRLYKYSFSSGEMTQIRDKKDEYTIWGITDDYVIVSDQDNQNISWLTKEDFEKGNYEARKEIQFVW